MGHRRTIRILKARQTVIFATDVGVQSILRKNAQNIPNRTHLTPAAHIAVYLIETDFVKIKGQDLILENKDTRNQEVPPNHDTPVHHTLDNNPMIKEKTDLAAIPTLETLAEVDPAHKKEKETTH